MDKSVKSDSNTLKENTSPPAIVAITKIEEIVSQGKGASQATEILDHLTIVRKEFREIQNQLFDARKAAKEQQS